MKILLCFNSKHSVRPTGAQSYYFAHSIQIYIKNIFLDLVVCVCIHIFYMHFHLINIENKIFQRHQANLLIYISLFLNSEFMIYRVPHLSSCNPGISKTKRDKKMLN